MVRNIIGCLVYVGKGKYPPEWIKALLEGRTRAASAPTFSPAGLYLAGVRYDPKWNVPSFIDIPHEPAPVAVLPYFRRRTVCG